MDFDSFPKISVRVGCQQSKQNKTKQLRNAIKNASKKKSNGENIQPLRSFLTDGVKCNADWRTVSEGFGDH